ncbi:MAG: Myo-inositol-1-phosphate synthase [Candidatus Aramenus sulfurataquae]|uniref:Myo-inositol-1-phosphate synthase n=2 Tax=Candidatus Aramenus sulfurataquae TaxID=1326980 RepID=W7KP41_9CREN|nr:MAG: Myo-inositol-1-phosphate synthase [Candidatus Aramenus sulfurataquae]MCL7344187.1 L-myo-inositol-1-phosphate synthase [Candidatus Aramenus sulfurataquae]
MIKVAIAGVGNSASALLQGLSLAKKGEEIPGILKLPISPSEIEVVAAFDVDKRKVGKKLSEAIFEKPNVVPKYAEVKSDVIVKRGPTLDGIYGKLSEVIEESSEPPIDVVSTLKEEKVDVLLNLLPTGAEQATMFYAKSALEASVAFINATPTEVVKNLGKEFEEKRVPLFGDDLMSQVGGTAFHTGVIEFLKSRGIKVIRSYQIDISGNTETYVTLEDWRKEVKKGVKSNFITSRSDGEVVAGTSDYVEFLGDRRVSYIVIEGEYALGEKVRVDISLKTRDGANAVQPLVDLIRLAKIVKDRGIGGAIKPICGYYFKNSYRYGSFEEARKDLEEFLRKVMSEPRTEQ